MKRLIHSLLVIVFICFSIIGYMPKVRVEATEGNDITVSHTVNQNGSAKVSKGEFILKLTLSNPNGAELSNVTVNIDQAGTSSFSVTKSSSIINIDSFQPSDLTKGSGDINLIYDGGDSTRLPIKIKYTKVVSSVSTPLEVNTYLWINATPDSSIKEPEKPTPVDTTKYTPKLSVLSSTIPSGKPGEMISIPLQIKNISSHEAKNIYITPQLGEDNPLESDSLNLSQSISSISSGYTGSTSFNLRIGASAVSKVYPIKLKFEFDNAYGDPFSYETTIYVKVIGVDQGSSKLVIKDFYWNTATIVPGISTELSVNIVNIGTIPLKDIKVSLVGLKEDGFTVLGSSSSDFLSGLNAGEETTLYYRISASKKMTTGNYGISVKLEYKDGTVKDAVTDEQQFFIPVQGNDTQATKTVPKIILNQYSSNPTIVKAGQNFDLSMSFLNTSETKAVRNIKIFFTVNESGTEGGSIFTPVNSSNTFFIGNIPPKGKIDKSLRMYTIPDAKQKTYTITANFEYEDAEGVEYKSTDLIGIPVTQDTKIETSEIGFPPEAYPGQPFPISFDFYNTGKTILRNLMIKTEGDFDVQNGSYFVGNLDIGGSDHYEAMVTPMTPGQIQGAVVITFEDPTGQKSEIRKDFSMNVIDMPIPSDPGMDPGMNPDIPKEGGAKSLLTNKFLWGGAGVLILATAGIIIRKKILRKREGITLDE